jgi:hypothetical protein
VVKFWLAAQRNWGSAHGFAAMKNMGRRMNIRWIDFDRLEVYEAGALLVTLLAYPEQSEETHSEVHASLCAHALRVRCALDPDWALPSQPMKPIYALRRQDENDRFLRTLERRVRDRMIAGRMAIGFLKEAVTGEIPPGLKRLSINELARLVLDDIEYTEPENVETRIWRPSLPVIHLASALQLMVHLADPVIGSIGLESLLLGRNVIELLIHAAEYHEGLISQSRHLRVAPESLIRFRLA